MTKKEQFEQAMALCEKHKASKELVAGLTELLEPKKGGQIVDIESIVKRDGKGNIVELQCQASKVWLPANLLNFTRDVNSKIVNAAGEELYKISRQAQKLKSEALKTFKASKDAIVNDVLDGVISPAEGAKKIEALSSEPDYKSIKPVVAAPAEGAK